MADLTQAARTTVTMGVLVLLLLLGAVWGWSALTEPLPGEAEGEPPVCVVETLAKGDKVFPSQVTVSVLNAGQREGLAGRTMGLFEDQGFARGSSDNAPADTEVARAEIWTPFPRSAAVRLVASRLGRAAEVVERAAPAPGVVVVVGDDFTKLVKGRRSTVARGDEQVCSPPVG